MRFLNFAGPAILLGLFFAATGIQASPEKVGAAAEVFSNESPPALLLLTTYSADRAIEGWLMSEKLDGVRAYWDGQRLISRQGKVFAAPHGFTRNFPPFALDGELWLGRGRFAETVSIVNRQNAHDGWKDLHYRIFEVPDQPGGLRARLQVLAHYLQRVKVAHLSMIEQQTVKDAQQVQEALTRILALGGEGLVLRDPQARYHSGRSLQALKVKAKDDAECVVRGYTLGRGKYQGQVGALLCEMVDGVFPKLTNPNARLLKLGSGLSDAQRALPPPVGTLVTFEYSGLTQNGLPRFAVFKRVRQDGMALSGRERKAD